MSETRVYKAKYNNARITPRKLRLVVDLVRGLNVNDALTQLRFSNKDASDVVTKVLKSAAANAEHNYQVEPKNLKIHRIWVTNGLNYKRGKAVSRGRYHVIIRRGSHITVELSDISQNK